MLPCHTKPFLRPGLVIPSFAPLDATEHVEPEGRRAPDESPAEECDFCQSHRLEWRKCKLICVDCRHINKSCADL